MREERTERDHDLSGLKPGQTERRGGDSLFPPVQRIRTMSITLKKSVTGLAVLCATVALTSCADAGLASDAELVERARGIHESVITLDTHNDINAANFTAEQNYTMDLDN